MKFCLFTQDKATMLISSITDVSSGPEDDNEFAIPSAMYGGKHIFKAIYDKLDAPNKRIVVLESKASIIF